MMNVVDQALHDHFYHHTEIRKLMAKVEADLQNEKISAYMAAQILLQKYFGE